MTDDAIVLAEAVMRSRLSQATTTFGPIEGILAEAVVALTASLQAVEQERDAIKSRLDAANSWQPIETAPKDETTVLLFKHTDPSWDIIGFGYWFQGKDGSCGWIARSLKIGGNTLGLGHPTHWMKLPEPPTTDKS